MNEHLYYKYDDLDTTTALRLARVLVDAADDILWAQTDRLKEPWQKEMHDSVIQAHNTLNALYLYDSGFAPMEHNTQRYFNRTVDEWVHRNQGRPYNDDVGKKKGDTR